MALKKFVKNSYLLDRFKKSETCMSELFKSGVITFDSALKREILSSFGKMIDDEGYIVEVEDISQRVITPDLEEIKEEEFAGIRKGSEIYIKSDLPSLIELVDALRNPCH